MMAALSWLGGRRRDDFAPLLRTRFQTGTEAVTSVSSGPAANTASGLQLAAAHMAQGLCLFDAQSRLIASNPRFAEIYGLDPISMVPGLTLSEIVAMRYLGNAHPVMTAAEYISWRDKVWGYQYANDTVVELCNGRIVSINRKPMPDGGWVSTHEDITHRSRNEAQIAFLARHDPLTGLPNRVLFRERLNAALSGIESGRGVAVLYLDLDRFKLINDTLGHPVGDALLREVSARLMHCVRDMDTVARLGGDEFAIIQCGIDNRAAAACLAERLIDALRTPFAIDGNNVVTNTSIGVTLAPEDGIAAGKLLKNADLALYQAKGDGRGLFRFFTTEMDAAVAQRRRLETDLQRALARDEFLIHYQPQFDIVSGGITGVEALLRWQHPTRGLLLPADFIPVAEDTGLINAIGRWVLRRACQDAASWPDHCRIAVNLSAAQFRDVGLPATVIDVLRESGIKPERLELEITETILLHNDAGTLDMLRAFRDQGIHIAMDDFGSGYSSLAYLRKFPFTRVKIDQCFTRDLGQSPEAETIVSAIAQLASALGLQTTVEGVETADQLRILRRTGCEEAQGFLLGRAIPPAEITKLLAAASRDRALDKRVVRAVTVSEVV